MNPETIPTPTPTADQLERISTKATEALAPYVPLAITLGVIALVLLALSPRIISRYLLWKEVNGYTRLDVALAPIKATYRGIYRLITKREAPRRWSRVRQPRELLNDKERLMTHADIMDALTTKNDEHLWIVERGTYEKAQFGKDEHGNRVQTGTITVPKPHMWDFKSWLSPYPEAVRYFCKIKPSYNSKTHRYLPRKRVRLMADRLIIREATASEARGLNYDGQGYGFFVIEVYADHTTPDKIRAKLEASIKTALGLEALRELSKDDPRKLVWLALKPGVKKPLENAAMPTGEAFIKAHPANRELSKIPFAVSETGEPWVLVPHHTLLVGKSGAGKSSLLNMICAQLSDAVLDGRAEVYAIDPKENGEIRTHWGRTNFFKATATVSEVDKWFTIIDRFHELMESGDIDDSKFTRETLNTDALKQNTFKASRKTPLRILFIEELPSFMDVIKTHPEGKHAVSKLNQILRKGRSNGHFIFSAAQNIEKSRVEPLDPKGFITKIPLALNDSPWLLNLMLGDGAAERGYDTRKFNPKDNPEHPGLGYAVGDDGDPIMIRIPYFDGDQLVRLLSKHLDEEPTEPEAPVTTDAPQQAPLPRVEDVLPTRRDMGLE